MSVGRDRWDKDMVHRDVYSLRALPEISAVTNAASPTTSIGLSPRSALLAGTNSPRAGRHTSTRDLRSDSAEVHRRGQLLRLRVDADRIAARRAARPTGGRLRLTPYDPAKAAEIERLERNIAVARNYGDTLNVVLFQRRLAALRGTR